MPDYILTSDGLCRAAMQDEVGRGGYFPPSSGTTETQTMLIKGACEAYKATGFVGFLEGARKYANALIKYYHFETEPPTSGLWPCQWITNAGGSFKLQGPVSSVSPVYSGNVGASITFTNGTATIANLSRIYKVGSSTAVYNWNNVFSEIVSGSEYQIEYFYDEVGAKFDKDNNYLNEVTVANAGKVKLAGAQASYSGTCKVNYSIYISTTIPFGANFECWPLWRVLEPTEWKCAGDSIHWLYDAFSLLYEVDTTQTDRWGKAKAACLRNWSTCISLDASTYASKKEVGKLYDSWPLTFYRAIVSGNLVTYPSSYLNVSRDASGYVKFVLPADTNRSNFNWNNESIFITANWSVDADGLDLNIGTSAATSGEVILRDDTDHAYHCRYDWTSGSVPTTTAHIPLSWFNASYSWGTAASPCWNEGSGMQYHMSITGYSAGVGFGGNFSAVPPPITYNLTGGDVAIRVTNSAGSQATTYLSAGINTITPTAPSGGLPIYNIDFLGNSTGTNTIVVNTPAGVKDNVSGVKIRKIEINLNTTAANTILIGDVKFTGACVREEIPYNNGALPFQLSSDNPATVGTLATAANFQGPYYMGYQNPVPYIGLNDYAKAEVMMDMMIAAQTAYYTNTGISGPYAPVYLPNTWDSVMFGGEKIFTWGGPDPNTHWGGFQYRPFAAIADFWQRCILANVTNGAVTKAATATNAFLTWLDTWLTEHPGEPCIPVSFPEGADPVRTYSDPGMIATCLKGAIFAKKAGADAVKCNRVIAKLFALLVSFNITSGDMLGSFTPDPDNGVFYGFWAGEMLEALALYKQIIG